MLCPWGMTVAAEERSLEERLQALETQLEEHLARIQAVESRLPVQRHWVEPVAERPPTKTAPPQSTQLDVEVAEKLQVAESFREEYVSLFKDVYVGHGYEIRPDGASYGRTLLRHVNGFYDHFKLHAVVKTDGELTALTAQWSSSDQGSNIFLLGDSVGKIYVFRPSGDLLHEHETGSESPITHLTHFLSGSKETTIASCHADGEIRLHLMMQIGSKDSEKTSRPRVDRMYFNETLAVDGSMHEFSPTIYATRIQNSNRYLISYESGHVLLVKLNGFVLRNMTTPSKILSVRTDHNQVVLGHRRGISLYSHGRLRNMNCSETMQLNIQSFAFDVERMSRAYGITTENKLLTFVLRSEEGTCRIRHQTALELPGERLQMRAMQGYLLISSTEGLAVVNLTLSMMGGPRTVFVEHISNITRAFGLEVNHLHRPLLAVTPKGAMQVALHLDSGMVAFFQSHFYSTPMPEFLLEKLYRPLVITTIVMVIVWKLYQRFRANSEEAFHHRSNYYRRSFMD